MNEINVRADEVCRPATPMLNNLLNRCRYLRILNTTSIKSLPRGFGVLGFWGFGRAIGL